MRVPFREKKKKKLYIIGLCPPPGEMSQRAVMRHVHEALQYAFYAQSNTPAKWPPCMSPPAPCSKRTATSLDPTEI